jgi:CheY-like chemotaxis protein
MMTTEPKILCADDEPEVLKFLEAVLVRNGYGVTKASDGRKAVEELEKRHFDLVISDVMMPGMNGLEVCRRIKRDERFRHIPVILITGLAAKEDRVKGIEAGAEDFISKPIAPKEVLARIKMLLEAKILHERRIGELLIDMGFITEEQLQEALIVAKERNLKVGEALHALGVLDKDRLYWVLSVQLKMNYIELTREMVDKELIKGFSMDTLKEILCLPINETPEEIDFAVADPTDQDAVRRVKGLKPEKRVNLHLALPEKIGDILDYVAKEAGPQRKPGRIVPLKEAAASSSSSRNIAPRPLSGEEPFWDEIVSLLFLMGENEASWFYRTPYECRLFSQKGNDFRRERDYPPEAYLLIRARLRHAGTSRDPEGRASLFLREEPGGRQGVFRWDEINCLDGEMIRVRKIPEFSAEDFFSSYPHAPGLIRDFQELFSAHPRLLLGAEDLHLLKQCCYLLLHEELVLTPFPPPVFVEREIEIYFPGVAQLSKRQPGMPEILDSLPGESVPLLFCETGFSGGSLDDKFCSKVASGSYKGVILHLPLPSPGAMKTALSPGPDWGQKGFRAFFLCRNRWESV